MTIAGEHAKQGADVIKESQDHARPDVGGQEPANESLELDTADEALDFISLELDEPSPATVKKQGAQPLQGPGSGDGSGNWYTDAYGNWISAEEYQHQWELYAEAQQQESAQV